MKAKMNSDTMVLLTNYGVKVLKKKIPTLKAIPDFNDNLQTIKAGDNTILRTPLRTLFMIFGDQLIRKRKPKRVFVSDAIEIAKLPKPKPIPPKGHTNERKYTPIPLPK